jgi:hypothetical protein
VANCEGELSQHGGQVHLVESKVRFYEDTLDIQYTPSTDWAQGGPIIAQERIGLKYTMARQWSLVAWVNGELSTVHDHWPNPTHCGNALLCRQQDGR